ncbi:MAG: tripartite tricarboxylate transporter TctB family protein [Deltaproteobacteria bacterium]|nr:tripartite tricarboxylate transporter TctB family protein [Deltaproteobacteria bacterium]
MRVSDFYTGLGSALLGGIIYVLTIHFPALEEGGWIGPALFPRILAILFAFFGTILMVQGVIRRSGAPPAPTRQPWLTGPTINALCVIAAIIFYIVVSEFLGFLVTAFIILTLLMLKLEVKITVCIPTSLLLVAGIYYLFAKMLRVPLPWGILGW